MRFVPVHRLDDFPKMHSVCQDFNISQNFSTFRHNSFQVNGLRHFPILRTCRVSFRLVWIDRIDNKRDVQSCSKRIRQRRVSQSATRHKRLRDNSLQRKRFASGFAAAIMSVRPGMEDPIVRRGELTAGRSGRGCRAKFLRGSSQRPCGFWSPCQY